ncbi:SDR family NAD(P)-dependent oxidoreductase [Methylorubrum zatmanii]|uniref:SDR family NAD(P)-dependent oxidoreductase n=1 Tax=Methylorubrum zatmanii TaxID=29429 RepID=A0ABW1WQ28_9HYPH|nr:SDR family oxidoreductase [Methylorubrum zatmanii]MBD8906208.1 acetoin dehydrogenase [Methylorubrum zatmanii]
MARRFVLRGRTALVTGAASGIGAALSLALARRGCALALADRDAQGLATTAGAARAAGVAVSEHVLDLTDRAAVSALPAAVQARHGGLHLLVNNAGVALGGRFEETDLADIDWLMEINLHAVMRLTHACLPLLRAGPQAQIVNLSSVFGIIAPAGQAAYAASKFAVRGFTEALRHEYEGTGLGVTLVHPGGVATAIARNARAPRGLDAAQAARGLAAFERLLTMRPEIAAEAILRGIEARAPRVVIGADARRALLIQRLLPVRYWSLIRRSVRDR